MESPFSQVLGLLSKHGRLELTFNKENVAKGDSFLIFSAYPEQKIKIGWIGDLVWVIFDGDSPMLLENCPESFLESIIKVAGEQL